MKTPKLYCKRSDGEVQIAIETDIGRGGYAFYIYQESDDGKMLVAQLDEAGKIEMVPVDPCAAVEPLMVIGGAHIPKALARACEVHGVMVGVNGKMQGALDAQGKHLQDMRAIVAKSLGVILPGGER